jgi:thioredoxin
MYNSDFTPDTILHIESIEELNNLIHENLDSFIVLTFETSWCSACKMFSPILQQSQKEFEDKNVIFAKIDAEKFPQASNQFNVTGTPTTIVILNKKLIHRQVGVMQKPVLSKLLNTVLNAVNN